MCVLRAQGKTFDAHNALALSGLTAIKVFHAGDPLLPLTKPDGKICEFSGFTVKVSNASWENVDKQAQDAIDFLKEREHNLTLLRSAPGLEYTALDFPVDLRIDGVYNFAQYEYFPQELVSRAGALSISIEISVYWRGQDLKRHIVRQKRSLKHPRGRLTKNMSWTS